MTLCPIAIAVGCAKCPAFAACPLKGVIGDVKKDEGQGTSTGAGSSSKATDGSRPKKP